MPDITHTLKMDLQNNDLLMFFKPWQLECMKTLWNNSDGLSSREVWEPIKDDIGRASVINFLEAMTLEGLLDKHEITGKARARMVYHID